MPSFEAVNASPRYFATAARFRVWLEKNHASAVELLVGFYNKSSDRGGLTYAEAVDEALCFGWIDGIVHKLDASSHTRRFTPRRPGSIWSNVNVRHVARLAKLDKMQPAGVRAFEARKNHKTGIYTYEQPGPQPRPQQLPAALEKIFRAQKSAWSFWSQQPPGYRRTAIWWVISAKQEITRQRRLAQLVADSAAGRRLGMLGK